jgi:ABC-type uncharacterized transport system ATPase subunit
MSAFIVNKTHIDAIVTAIVDCPNINISRCESALNSIGQILWDENYKSVNYRYNEDEKTPKYLHKVKHVSLVQAIKAINCLNYQSCEHPEYDNSESKKIQNSAKEFLFKKWQFHNPKSDKKVFDAEYEKAAFEVI